MTERGPMISCGVNADPKLTRGDAVVFDGTVAEGAGGGTEARELHRDKK